MQSLDLHVKPVPSKAKIFDIARTGGVYPIDEMVTNSTRVDQAMLEKLMN